MGDRLSQTVGAATTHYVLDPGAGLTQVLSDGTNTYLYGNDRLAQYQASMQYFGADGLGSVRQIYDASAIVVGSTRYDPYGNVMSHSGATSVFAFAGEQYDATGLTYLRARYYSAAQGRFTTHDAWLGDPDAPMSYNAWNYTNGNPVMYADPSGKCPLCVLTALGLLAFFNTGCSTPAVDTPVPPTPTPPPTKFAYAVPYSVANDSRLSQAWLWLKETEVREPNTGTELADAYANFAGTVTWGSFSEYGKDCNGSTRIDRTVTVSAIDVDNFSNDVDKRRAYTAAILGHEAVHVINPYRACRGSLYEEFHAYELEEQVKAKILTTRRVLIPAYDMGQYDPLSRASLRRFFDTNHRLYLDMVTNKQLDEYPPGILPRP